MTSNSEPTIIAELGNFDVLIVLNELNGSPPLTAGNKALVDTALGNGSLKGLMVYDRFANVDPNVPGLQSGDVVRSLSSANVAHPTFVGLPPISGPFGSVGTFTGNFASHGYIKQTASIMPMSEQHYRQQLATQRTTTIQYNRGSGVVMYSTIPMDYYLQTSRPIYKNTIFPNALCHFVTAPTPPGGGGDPHFKTWKNEHYQYHGQCDLVLAKDANFAGGLGLDIHIRTKLVRFWSFIKTAVIRIGNDILEIEGSAEEFDSTTHYWYNYEYRAELETFAGFPVKQFNQIGTRVTKNRMEIDLSSKYPGVKIVIATFKEFIKVSFSQPTEEAFGNTVGMLGDFKTGKTLARDGSTELDEWTDFGREWQVLPADGKLFRSIETPQFPELCVEPEDPQGSRVRRLGESSISEEQAEKACASIRDEMDRKDCVYDIIATQDLDMVGAF